MEDAVVHFARGASRLYPLGWNRNHHVADRRRIGGGVALFPGWTTTLPTRPTSVIVADEIYRYTRNPTYIRMIIVLTSIALLANSW
jgi:hypothetical protein